MDEARREKFSLTCCNPPLSPTTAAGTAAARSVRPLPVKEFFHTAGNFGEHHEEAQKASVSHPVLPWIMFFQNVDAIMGPDEPIVYPEHLTEELDYELELGVVLKKSGKHFWAIIPCTTKHPLCWPR